MANPLSRRRLNPTLLALAALALVLLGLLAWKSWRGLDDSIEQQLSIARGAVAAETEILSLYLQNATSRLLFFALQQQSELEKLAAQPTSQDLRKTVFSLLKLHFPEAVSFALSENRGNVLTGNDAIDPRRSFRLKQFAQGLIPAIDIEAVEGGYRFELMVPWLEQRRRRGVLLVVLQCGALCNQLTRHLAHGHGYLLSPRQAPPTATVYYGQIDRLNKVWNWLDYQKVGVAMSIPNSKWLMVHQIDTRTVFANWTDAVVGNLVLLTLFLVTALVLFAYTRRHICALRGDRQQQAMLLEQTTDLIWRIDTKGIVTWTNEPPPPPAPGLASVELLGHPFIEFAAKDQIQDDLDAFRRLMEGQPCRRHLTRKQDAQGRQFYLNLSAIPLWDERKHVIGALGTATNVTDEMEARHRLQEQEQHYHRLFDESRNVKLVLDAESGDIVEANDAAAAFYGYPRTELEGMNAGQLGAPGEEEVQRNLGRMRDGSQICFTSHHRLADGAIREVEIDASPVQVGNRALLYATVKDITEKSSSLRAIRDNRAKLQAILDVSTEGIIMTDPAGEIQLFNPAAQMMFGYLEEDTAGLNIRALIPGFFGSKRDTSPGQIELEQMPSATRETSGVRKSGDEFPIRMSPKPVRLNDRPHVVALVQDLTEHQRNEQRLVYLAQNDVLTGLLNRREFERRLDAVLSLSETPDIQYVLCYMDVDQFKLVNDTCGHAAGDALLKQLAILVKSQLRKSETVARLGGDEFGALLTDCTIEEAQQICDGLLQTVRNFLFTWKDQSFDVALSIGLAAFSPHSTSASQILSEADVACHMAKTHGRDRIHVYHGGDAELIRHHGDMHLVSVISQALNEERFHLYAQPIVPVAASAAATTHYEVLVRMVDEGGNLVIPDEFIPAAERYILMPAIDRWIINRLFSLQGENLRRWANDKRNGNNFLFAINLSGTSLIDEGFLSYLKRQFKDHKIPYRTICFEVTETVAIANLERARTLITELRSLGCSFALDDFGTGMSSYSYLKDLPVDFLKIDGSFVRTMTEDPVNYAMVESINQIGHILGLKTIAEWVENNTTLTQLRALNVDFAQGYGVGEGISVEDFQLQGTTSTPAATRIPDGQNRLTL